MNDYSRKYKRFLDFECEFCGATKGNTCLSMNAERGIAIPCNPHASRYNQLREEAERKRLAELEIRNKSADVIEKWLMN